MSLSLFDFDLDMSLTITICQFIDFIIVESDRANLANVNISNIFWNLMENAERRKASHEGTKRKPSLVEFTLP